MHWSRPRGPRWVLAILCLLLAFPALAGDDDFKRERGKNADGDRAKDSLEGKAPPRLQVDGWQNTDGKALTWADLRGKVVVIDFWGTW